MKLLLVLVVAIVTLVSTGCNLSPEWREKIRRTAYASRERARASSRYYEDSTRRREETTLRRAQIQALNTWNRQNF